MLTIAEIQKSLSPIFKKNGIKKAILFYSVRTQLVLPLKIVMWTY